MKTYLPARACFVVALLSATLVASVAEAQKPRSSIDRRSRPNGGFWESNSGSRSSSVVNRSQWGTIGSQRTVVNRTTAPTNLRLGAPTVMPSTGTPLVSAQRHPAFPVATPTVVTQPKSVIYHDHAGQIYYPRDIYSGPVYVPNQNVLIHPSSTVHSTDPSVTMPQAVPAAVSSVQPGQVN